MEMVDRVFRGNILLSHDKLHNDVVKEANETSSIRINDAVYG